ncbi:hypothetical protein B5M09_011767 [Aphanomyces astaci]|uniref:Uncharacterized protein n=1 Tax=Aphanomyces astaci TaxID=112090 RepID=A0A425DJ54_APHAT|nr:hypothetical protein B5M09_011767 [Aphanomyces astaci]
MTSHENKPADLEERLSYIHSKTAKDFDGYIEAKSPKDLEEGALADGGALDLWSREAFALYIQYGAVGVMYGILPALRYPIFNIYLNLEGYREPGRNSPGYACPYIWSDKM